MHGTMKSLKENTDKLVGAIHELIDRIHPRTSVDAFRFYNGSLC
jgi:hypothetical protein